MHRQQHADAIATKKPSCSLEVLVGQSQINEHGGATYITSWGKFWLAVLGCYSWDGMNPTPPEIWLLPYAAWTGIGLAHPGRFWCHCRMVRTLRTVIEGARLPPCPAFRCCIIS